MRQKKTRAHYYYHAQLRAKERYGLQLEMSDWEAMNIKVQEGKGLWLMKESHTRSHWLLDDQFIVVYEKTRRGIVTFLPPEAIDNYLKRRAHA